MDKLSVNEFISHIHNLDNEFRIKFERARKTGSTLRYVATIEAGKCSVGLKTVLFDSTLGKLKGADKVVLLYTNKNPNDPVIIKGRGAGPDNAALDVINDIIDIYDPVY